MSTPSTAVLFVHGIQGQPGQFRFLIDALPEDVEICAPLLPGHGQNAKAFHASTRRDWLAAVRRETEVLLAQGKRVIYVGHSMGCLLGLLISRDLGEPYAGMLLLCCPFLPRVAGRFGDLFRSLGRRREGEDPRVTASREGNSVPTEGFADLLRLLRPYVELFRLMGAARRIRPREPEKLRLFFSENDEVVSAASVRWARKWPKAEVRVLQGCGHCYFPESAAQTLRKELIELIEVEK